MKIAIDISPLQTGHKVRGVGFYLENLKKSLLQNFPEYDYIFFSRGANLDKTIDVVHYPYFDPFFLTLPFFKHHKIVVTVHDLTPLVFPKHFPAGVKGKFKWELQKFNLQRADAIITDSIASKKDIIKIAGISEEKISVAYLAAGEDFKKVEHRSLKIDGIRKKYNLPDKFALYVGDVTWNKNLPRLLKAIKKSNIPLVMVGKALVEKKFDKENVWNKNLKEVQELVDNTILRLGFVPTEDLVILYNAATVFVMPSIYEGFGLPVLEAMQSGCPVITTHGGSLKEVAKDAAYVVDEYDIDSIANGITQVFQSSSLQKELSIKGLHQAKKFNWKKTAEETVSVYKKVLNSK